MKGGCGPTVGACSGLDVTRHLSCVGRGSILIAIPLSLVVCMSYNNRPGVLTSGARMVSDPLLWEGLSWTGLLWAFMIKDSFPSPPFVFLSTLQYFCLF